MQPKSNPRPFAHFVLMRFNVRTKHAAEPRDAAIRARADWLETRFQLFEEFCWPTLQAQSSKNFELHVYFDNATPTTFLERFRNIVKDSPFVRIVLCEFFDSDFALREVQERLPFGTPWILTTRLDNDDGLHRDFIKTVQNAVRPGVSEAINFPLGLVLTDRAIYSTSQRSNAFISVFEDVSSCKTVLQVSHNEMVKRFGIREISTYPMWFQHVHGGNVSNKIRGRRLSSSHLPDGFQALHLAERVKPVGQAQAGLENATIGILRSGRDMLSKARRRLRS